METIEQIINEECRIEGDKIIISDKLETRLTQHLLFEKMNKKYERQRSSKGFVYLIKQGKYYKIGRATKMNVRLRKYYSENPEPIDLLGHAYVSDYIQKELDLQKKLESKYYRGEWYILNEDDVQKIKNCFKEWESN